MSGVRRFAFLMICGACLAASTGCMRSLWNDFLDPSEVGRYHGPPVTSEIRATLGLLDEEAELVGATDPLPEDTVVVAEEYQIGPGDIVDVSIHDLLRAGSLTTETRRVSELGYISLPVIERININQLTESQAEEAIKLKLKQVEHLPDPIVGVVVRQPMQRQFTIVGYLARPGPQPIPRSDFRILEALSYAGPIPDEIEKVYVIRRVSETSRQPAGPTSAPSTGRATPAPVKPSTDRANSRAPGGLREDIDRLLNDIEGGAGAIGSAPSGSSSPALASHPMAERAEITPSERRELLGALSGGGDSTEATSGATGSVSSLPETNSSASTSAGSPSSGTSVTQDPVRGLSKWIWVNGEWVEVPDGPAAKTEPGVPETIGPERPPTTTEWDAVADAGEETRVIQIPVKPLHAGEARYNIVIRPGDVISVPTPEGGKRYYVMGHVRGPGAYAIPPEGITLKAAVASAGGLDPYAWPSRCEIARKIGPDQEELHQVDLDRIFAMKDQDIKIKPGDVINVGTHPLAPFMVSIANGFRTTYGFGFVYDRNFGTIDSFSVQQNPRDRRRAEKNARFQTLRAAFPGL